MKRIAVFFSLLLLLSACGGEPEAEDHTGEVLIPAGVEELIGENYQEAVRLFEGAGFTNLRLDPQEDLITGWMTKDGEIESIAIDGVSELTPGLWVPQDTEVRIVYHTFKEKEEKSETEAEEPSTQPEEAPAQQAEESPTEAPPQQAAPPIEQPAQEPQKEAPAPAEPVNLTVENSQELARILTDKECSYADYSAFVAAHKGETIEFDGSVDYIDNYIDSFKVYDTRFDILLSAGPYDADHQIGPTFKFENVAVVSLDISGNSPGYVDRGQNLHIIAKVVSFDDNTGIFYLDPISLIY